MLCKRATPPAIAIEPLTKINQMSFAKILDLCKGPECVSPVILPAKQQVLQKRNNICWHCYKENPVYRCSKCHFSWYCDSVCQKLNWKKGHREECRMHCEGMEMCR